MNHKFPRELTIDKCEQFVKEFLKDSDVHHSIEIPKTTIRGALGGYAAAIQSLITVFRNQPQTEIILKGDLEEKHEIISEVVNKPHKFAASMFAKSIKLQDKEIKFDIYNEAKNSVEQQAKSKNGQNYGNLCWYIFVDHSTKGFDKNFYIESNESIAEPRQLEQIKSVIADMVARSASMAGGMLSRSERDNIGRLFYELFMNTHEHGTRTENRNNWLRPGVRTVYSNGLNLSDVAIKNGIRQSKPLEKYFSYFLSSNERPRKFVEISLVDSGLGLYGRWKADHADKEPAEDSLADEYGVIRKCFLFRNSSSADENKGLGLPVVMERLSGLKGFLKIRTGRLSLYRDFILMPYDSQETLNFMDWSTEDVSNNSNLTEMDRVEGVSVSLLIPLEAKL